MAERGCLLLGGFESADDAAACASRVVSAPVEMVRSRWPDARQEFLSASPARANSGPGDLDEKTQREAAKRMDAPLFQASLKGRCWRLANVPLLDIIAAQPLVNLDRVVSMSRKIAEEGLIASMFPLSTSIDVFADASDGPTVTLTSSRGELVVSGVETRRQSDFGAIEVVFRIEPRPNYASVMRCGSRLIVRNGNHRLVAAWQAGIRDVPCVVIDADADELVKDRADRFRAASLFAVRPPLLCDLAAGSAGCISVALRRRRTMTRLSAQQSVMYD